MDRREILTRSITKDMIGVEVGPWFNPLVPKAEGYRSLALDVFDREQLLDRARRDDAIPESSYALIEKVDLLGSAADLARLVEKEGLAGQIDYIVSSHNFEHLPNPVLFLQGCQSVLKEGGLVSMAIPDRRGSFDYFRPISTTADFLEAFHVGRKRPTAASVYELASLSARRSIDNGVASSWEHTEGGGAIYSVGDLLPAYDTFKSRSTTADAVGEYVDNHCSVFTRSSFELIILDLQFLGLIDLGIDYMDGPAGCEFYTRLKKGMPVPEKALFEARRAELLQAVVDESGGNSRKTTALAQKIAEQDTTIKLLQARVNSLLATPSWRWTAPLRLLHRYFGEQ